MTSFNATSPREVVTSPSGPALVASCCFYVLPLVVGIAGNAWIVQIILSHKSLRTSVNAYIANMAALDLAVCTLLVPLRMVYYLIPVQSGLLALCKAGVFFHSLLDAGRLLFLGAISFERYQAVANPFQRDKAAAARRAAVTLAVLWGVMLVYAAVTTEFFYDTIMFELCAEQEAVVASDGAGAAAAAGGSGHANESSQIDWSLWGGIEIYFVLPLSLLTVALVVVCYALMFRMLSRQSKKMQSHSGRTGSNSKAQQANKSKGFLKKKKQVSPADPISPEPVKSHLYPPPPPPPPGGADSRPVSSAVVSTVDGSELNPTRITLVKESTSRLDNVGSRQFSPVKDVGGVHDLGDEHVNLAKDSASKSDDARYAHSHGCTPVQVVDSIPEVPVNASDTSVPLNASQVRPEEVSPSRAGQSRPTNPDQVTSAEVLLSASLNTNSDTPGGLSPTNADDLSHVNPEHCSGKTIKLNSAQQQELYNCPPKRVCFSPDPRPVTDRGFGEEADDDSAVSRKERQPRVAVGTGDSATSTNTVARPALSPGRATSPPKLSPHQNSNETQSPHPPPLPRSDAAAAAPIVDGTARSGQAKPRSAAVGPSSPTLRGQSGLKSAASERSASQSQNGLSKQKPALSPTKRQSSSAAGERGKSDGFPLGAKPGTAPRVGGPAVSGPLSAVKAIPRVSFSYPPLVSALGGERGTCVYSAVARFEDLETSREPNAPEFEEHEQPDPPLSADTEQATADPDSHSRARADTTLESRVKDAALSEEDSKDNSGKANSAAKKKNLRSNSEEHAVIMVKEAQTPRAQDSERFKDKADQAESAAESPTTTGGDHRTADKDGAPTQTETSADENGEPQQTDATGKEKAAEGDEDRPDKNSSPSSPGGKAGAAAEGGGGGRGGDDTSAPPSVKSVKVVDMDGTAHVEQVTNANIQGSVCMYNPKNRVQGKRRVELKVAKRLVVVFLSFLLLWIPYPFAVLAVRLLHMKGDAGGGGDGDGGRGAASPWLPGVQQMAKDVICVLSALTTVTAAVNPVFYGLANVNIRSVIVARLKRVCKCCLRQ